MSNTVIAFTPTSNTVFSFTATLDGVNYTCVVTWNLWAQRWYLNIYSISPTALVVCKALIASPDNYPINLVFGYFTTSTLVFYDENQTFVVTP
jgi:hypothetical protein